MLIVLIHEQQEDILCCTRMYYVFNDFQRQWIDLSTFFQRQIQNAEKLTLFSLLSSCHLRLHSYSVKMSTISEKYRNIPHFYENFADKKNLKFT